MKVLLREELVIDGKTYSKGEEVTLKDSVAQYLISIFKAVPVDEPITKYADEELFDDANTRRN